MAGTPPMYIGALAVLTLVGVYGLNLGWVQAIALGLGGAGVLALFTMPRYKNLGMLSLVVAAAVWFGAPMLAAGTTSSSASNEVTSTATFSALASANTSGLSISGNTIVVPETYNSTANTLDKDPYIIEFSVVRTDTGNEDASFSVEVTVPNKITDPATGLTYNTVELDSNNQPKIYIYDASTGTWLQDTKRIFQMPFGTSSKTVQVKVDLNPTAFDYANLYQAIAHNIIVGGNTFSVSVQKTSETS